MRTDLFAVAIAALALTAIGTPARADGSATTWTGIYLGVNAGWSSFDSNWTDVDDDWGGNSAWDGVTYDAGSEGGTLGGQAGYNFQMSNNLVVGAEANFNVTDNTEHFDDICDSGCVVLENNMNWFATLRGRAGFALGSVLPYVSAGVALGNFTHRWTEAGDPTDSWPDFGGTDVGWTGGGGVQYAFAERASVRVDALYLGFDDVTSANQQDYRMTVDRSALVITAGINVKVN